jgi:hypothetical protein
MLCGCVVEVFPEWMVHVSFTMRFKGNIHPGRPNTDASWAARSSAAATVPVATVITKVGLSTEGSDAMDLDAERNP